MSREHYIGRLKIDKKRKKHKPKISKIQLFKDEVAELKKQYEEFDSSKVESFKDFPLSQKSKRGLHTNAFETPTEIQKESIGLALKGHDILGAAKTGSGKTLAFIIPMLECLYTSGWSCVDGLGALVITPTRELAYQIYEVLNRVGSSHNFSVGLIIGGKDLQVEKQSIDRCNIIICTPGRLLQHMDENANFNTDNIKMLILDEADHILSLGFQEALNAILDNLPVERQTLLFSATQTKSVKDLARLSLKNPVYVSVHEHAKHITPEGLEQNYIVCEAYDKMNMIWSFIKSHKKQKILIFMATCKQVKFTYESICRLRPGVSIMALYGSLHQLRRMQVYDDFCRKNFVVMFATDVAARGLDFPNVNWVVQLDCPEDVNTYIHRVGRTARYLKGGQALLVLLPSEKESMVEQLKKRKIPLDEIKVNPSKLHNVQKKLEAICARDVNLKDSGQRCLKSYLKNLYIMKDKTVFDVSKVDIELYARSIGLASAPRIRYLEKRQKNLMINKSTKSQSEEPNLFMNDCSDGSDDDLLKPKSCTRYISDGEEVLEDSFNAKKVLTKAAVAKRILKKNIKVNTVMKFDENGEPIGDPSGKLMPKFASEPNVVSELQKELEEEGYSIEKAKLLKEKTDEVDKALYREMIKAKHRERKLKLKQKKLERQGGGVSAVLDDKEGEAEENSAAGSESDNDIDPNTMSHSESESEEEFSAEANESTDEGSRSPLDVRTKRKNSSPGKTNKRLKTVDKQTKTRSIEDEEQLALHLLTNT